MGIQNQVRAVGVDVLRRRAIPMGDKRAYAAGSGCCPGGSVPIECGWCDAPARMCWDLDRKIRLTNFFEWDHWLPVALGGHSRLGNILPTCRTCNRWKRDKHPRVFAREVFAE